jgi:hypothetical protein
MQSGRSSPMFQRNVLPPSSGPKSMPSKQQAEYSAHLLGLLFSPKGGGSTDLWNIGEQTAWHHSPEDSILHGRHCQNLTSNIVLFWLWHGVSFLALQSFSIGECNRTVGS